MNEKEKMAINIGVMIVGYACAVNEQLTAAEICAVLTVIIAVQAHSLKCLRRNLPWAGLLMVLMSLILRFLGLNMRLPGLSILGLANAINAVLWAQSGQKARQEPMWWFLVSMVLTSMIAVLMPARFMAYFTGTLRTSLMKMEYILISLYLPLFLTGTIRWLLHFRGLEYLLRR